MFDVLNDMLSTSPHTPGFQPRLQEKFAGMQDGKN